MTGALLVFDGQSLNAVPGPRACYPTKLMAALDPAPGRVDVWIAGCPWTVLAADPATRLHPHAAGAARAVLLMCGGQSDLQAGAGGSDLYEVQVAYALRARAAGFSHVVNVTIVPSTIYSSAAEAERLEHNALLVADAQGAFDDVVDLATVDHLDDPSDSIYYFDGLHWTGPATTIVSDVMLPHVRAMLAS